MGSNSDLLGVLKGYMQEIVQDWVKGKGVSIKIEQKDNSLIYPSASDVYVSWDNQSLGKVLITANYDDTATKDGDLILGMKVGSLEYDASKSVEIEGGYSYSVIMDVLVSDVEE